MKYNNLHVDIMSKLKSHEVNSWSDISNILCSLKNTKHKSENESSDNYLEKVKTGIAFITFDYGIDGVSIEIEKYALCLEELFKNKLNTGIPIHFIGGDFHDKADTVLKPRWHRFKIPDMNGWSKWSDGKWFAKLFYEDMPENSIISKEIAKEIWKQALNFSDQLSKYLIDNNINLLIPVNICSNPGNPAIAIAIALVSEELSTKVIASNHDYYWEGGMPYRPANKEKGPRDHFFKNHTNIFFLYNI